MFDILSAAAVVVPFSPLSLFCFYNSQGRIKEKKREHYIIENEK